MKYLGPSYRQNNQPFKIGDIPMGGFVQVEFVKIVDGDTAHFLLDGKEVTVRFLVINTPEMHPIVKPYATEAKNYTNMVLSNAKIIHLQSDKNDSLYDNTESHRLLAWVWVDYKLLNYQLVEKGYASVRYVNSEKLLYLDDLYKAQHIAIAKKRGIHNIKDGVKETA